MKGSSVVLAGFAIFAACTARADDLVIGFSMAKTGPFVSIANSNEIAVDLAVDEINAKGGVDGN
jgi:branched-chain amino acid transport system substrate-binding protein